MWLCTKLIARGVRPALSCVEDVLRDWYVIISGSIIYVRQFEPHIFNIYVGIICYLFYDGTD